MKCPQCNNVDFEPTEEYKYPIKNLGKKSYDTVNQRSYICLECGYAWKTEEVFCDHINIRGEKLVQQLYNYFVTEIKKTAPNKKIPTLEEFFDKLKNDNKKRMRKSS